MYILCVDSCGLSCHNLIKRDVLSLIKTYVYQATLVRTDLASLP
jgi:hypothetical protein